MRILGIESSCDDTAAAIVNSDLAVEANVVTNQDSFHARFGGIVPEIAGRQHVALMTAAVDAALRQADLTLDQLDGIAVTAGPGLIGSLVVGVATAKALAYGANLPLFGIHHLHGHIFAPFLDNATSPRYPMLAVVVSGGHTQFVRVHNATRFEILGRTIDDAAGEAFDKTARLLGLPFPGGPNLDRLAHGGNGKAVAFPRHRPERDTLDVSFSGLKTAARRFIESPAASNVTPQDIAASFQAAIVDVIMDRVTRATASDDYAMVTLSGGVAANRALQAALIRFGTQNAATVILPPPKYCTDNAAMIAAAAHVQGTRVRTNALTLSADPRLPFALD